MRTGELSGSHTYSTDVENEPQRVNGLLRSTARED